ncbi:MAG: helix-turn-helix domain-containing protein [Candidatus Aenigmarchaeota archaeon]|nr:helix-turn-helix domain-containing protein [Candidatus Aenigmarchaeota archaeon]
MDTSILEEIGLTEGEIKAYLALLTLGSKSTGPIAKESGVSRSKLYSVLDRLEKKGLASHIEKDGIRFFQAVEPSKIKDYLNKKGAELRKLETDFDRFLPQLEAFHEKAGKIQLVRVYQGFKGTQIAHEHLYLKLKKGDIFYYFGIPGFQPEPHHRYWMKDHERRIKAGIKCRLLFNNDTDEEVMINRNSFKDSDARYMPTNLKTPAYYLVYNDTLMIAIASENPIAIEIISQEIADSFISTVEYFWKLSKPFAPKKRK